MKHILPMALLGAISPFLAACNPRNSVDPNILFILVDDMGYGELTCYNSKALVPTPNIDRIAEKGVLMTQAYASPVSSPTRSAFLTGHFPQNIGVYGNHDGTVPGVGPMRPCFAEELQKEGYRTGWFGKWHQGWDVSNHPANNGFEVTYGFLGGMHDYHDPAEGDHYVGGPFAKNCYIFDGFRPVKEMKYLTEELTDRTIDFISESGDNPFFAYLAYNAPHTPVQAPEEVVMKYVRKGMEPVLATRCAMMDVLDREVGRILDYLEKNELRENTLVVFMSDNGAEKEADNGGLRGTKMTAWEGGIRVPMIASWPSKIPAGSKSGAICSIVDMASTFIGAAKNDSNLSYGDGVNLLPYYDGSHKGNAHDTLVFSIHLSGAPGMVPCAENLDLFAVRSGDWKLVVDKKRKVDALYNLNDDLKEMSDLSDSVPEKKEELYLIGQRFLGSARPSCGKIRTIDTRKDGDKIKIDSLIKEYSIR